MCFYGAHVNIEDNYHIEHKVPLSKEGSNYPENLALSCPDCNWAKGVKTSIEFFKYYASCVI